MNTLANRLRSAVHQLLHRDEAERELDDELSAYFESAVESKIAAGMNRAAAEREARLDFGSVAAVKDRMRDVGWDAYTRAVWDDLTFAWRRLTRNRWLTLTTASLIALSTALVCAAFNVVDALAFRDLAVPHPEQIVRISGKTVRGRSVLPHAMFDLLARDREHADPFVAQSTILVASINGAERSLFIQWADGNFFNTLGAVPERGKLFGADQHEPAVVISDHLWRTAFAGDTEVIGKTMEIGTAKAPIVGVMQPTFRGISLQANWDAVLPLAPLYQPAMGRPLTGLSGLETAARLPPGVSIAAYESYLNAIWPRLLEASVQPNYTLETWRQVRGDHPIVESLQHGLNYTLDARPDIRRSASLTLWLSLLIGVAACVTVALLAVARGMAAERQTSLILAIGGTPQRVRRTYLLESAMVSLLGGTLGLVLAVWLTAAGASFMPVTTDYDWSIHMTPTAIALASLFAMASLVAGGLMPLVVASRIGAHDSVRLGPGLTRPHLRLRTGLLVAQLALAVLLAHYSLMFLRDVRGLAHTDPGFNVSQLKVYSLTGTLPIRPLPARYFSDLTERVRAIPGIDSASVARVGVPFVSRTDSGTLPAKGDNGAEANVVIGCTYPGFFSTLQIPWLQGNDFSWNPGATAIISRSAARTLFSAGDALSHSLELERFPGWKAQRPLQIAGVVDDIAFNGPRLGPRPMVYMPCQEQVDQTPSSYVVLIFVRSGRALEDLRPAIAAATRAAGPQVIYREYEMANELRNAMQQERMLATLATALGLLVVLVTGVGLYAFASYLATLRSRELAIRSALGASRLRLSSALLKEIGIVVCAGSVVGLALTLVGRRMLVSVTTSLPSLHMLDLVAGVLVVAAIAAAAIFAPTWRILRLNLARALRIE